MQRIVRHRKAFYQKQNDLKNGNINFQYQNKHNDTLYPNQIVKHSHNNMMYQSISTSGQNIQQIQIKPSQQQAQHYSSYSQVNFCQVNAPKNQTQYFCDNYFFQVLNNSSNYQLCPKFLKNHKIDFNLRARMLDWMIEVTSSYKFNHKTYFAGVHIMDRYFQRQKQILNPTDLHIIGIVSMMIASKMEQVYPLKLRTVFQKIGHKKMAERDLTNQQSKISQILNYKLNSWTFFDLAIAKLHILIQNLNKKKHKPFRNLTNNHNYLTNSYNGQIYRQRTLIDQIQERIQQIENVCSYISKHLYYDYQFLTAYSLNVLSDAVLKLTFQVLKISSQFQSVCTSPQIEVQICKQKLVEKIRQFDVKFKGLNNLKKYTNPEIIKLVQRELQ